MEKFNFEELKVYQKSLIFIDYVCTSLPRNFQEAKFMV